VDGLELINQVASTNITFKNRILW